MFYTGNKPFDCPHCDKRFRTSGHRKTHITSHFKESSPRKPRRIIKRPPKPDLPVPDIALQEPILITDTGLCMQLIFKITFCLIILYLISRNLF